MASTRRQPAERHQALTIERRRQGRGFGYYRNGCAIRDRQIVERLAKLAVPPAYVDVVYAASPTAPLQAMGRDAAGRWQYRYHPDRVKVREQRKRRHLVRLIEALTRIRRAVNGVMATRKPSREFAMATAIALIDATGIRAGTSRHARLSGARGAVTMLKSSVRISGRSLTLSFKAKGGKHVVKNVQAPRLIPAIKLLLRLPGPRLFTYQADDQVRAIRARDVNAFLCDVASCKISLKDFRTLRASLDVVETLARVERGGSERRRKRQVKDAVAAAAEDLANTVNICRKSYVPDAVVEAFEKGTLNGNAKSSGGRPTPARQILTEVISQADR
jgi:DNA topoisomerase-1